MKQLPQKIKRFTRALQDEILTESATNFYAAKRRSLQRYNLEMYLGYMFAQKTKVLLVGEAPGYNGCRLTGIPFTSEYLVGKGVCGGKLFGKENGYKASGIRARKEQSATAMWSVLEEFEELPLLRNAFAFHPHKDGNEASNRKPTAKELEIGKKYLFELIKIFDIQSVIAVGNVADSLLNKMEVSHTKVRHPSYGGKKKFKEELRYNLQKT